MATKLKQKMCQSIFRPLSLFVGLIGCMSAFSVQAANTSVRWGKAPDQVLYLDESSVAKAQFSGSTPVSASSKEVSRATRALVTGIVPSNSASLTTKNGSGEQTLPVLRVSSHNRASARVPVGGVLVICTSAKTCAKTADLIRGAGWGVTTTSVPTLLDVQTEPGLISVQAAEKIGQIEGVQRADPNFWMPLQKR